MNEISVKTLYPDGSTSPYRALALPAFASLCLMAGALLVLFRTWDELAVPRWALVLAAAAGYVSASAAHRLSRRHGAFYLLGLVPWIPALLMPAACVRGLAAWVSGLTARWNVLHDGSAQLLNTAPDFVDEKAAAFVGAMLIAQAAHFVVVHRHRVLGAVLGGSWIALGLADGCFSPLGAALMLAGMLALYVSDISLHLTRAAWRTLGILLALLVAAAFLPDMDMQGIRGLREKAQSGVHELRYGADSLPGGVLAQADTLHSDPRGMLSVTEGQEKTLYLRGYIAGAYADGAWKPLPGLIYSEEYAGMMKWLSGRGFDPARQPAAYLALCGDSEAEPNDVTVETLAASREYVYIPGTANELSGARVTENERDSTSRAPLHSVRAFRLASGRADGCRGLGQSTADPRTADVSGERGGLPRLRLRQLYRCQRHNRADARPAVLGGLRRLERRHLQRGQPGARGAARRNDLYRNAV